MITLLLRLGRYLLKTSEPNVKPDTVVRSQYSDLDEKEDSDFISRKEFFGKVTSIHDGYGLVDNAVYFSFELLGNKQLPGVGNTVLVDARRTSTAEGWVAHSICWVSECWEEGNDNSSPVVIEPKVSGIRKPVVGCITDVTEGGRCYINHDEVIDLQDTVVVDFKPVIGDWVIVSEKDVDTKNSCIYEMRPSRIRNFQGKVTTSSNRGCVVDNSILIRFDDCDFQYQLRLGDVVMGTAIESRCDGYEWRVGCVVQQYSADWSRLVTQGRQKVKALTGMVTDKNGITITSPIDFGFMDQGENRIVTACIRNDGTAETTLKRCYFKNASQDQVSCSGWQKSGNLQDGNQERDGVHVPPGSSININIKCIAKYLGKFRELLVFEFEGFQIGRQVLFKIQDSRHKILKSHFSASRKYCRNPRNSILETSKENLRDVNNKEWIIPGRNLKRLGLKLPVFLALYPVPEDLKASISRGDDLQIRLPHLSQNVNMQNYKDKFSTLLYLEEIQCDADMHNFDMFRQCLREVGEYLILEVPGLAEGRPSLLVGDRVYLHEPDDSQGPTYEGYIHEIRGEDILLKFHQNFHDRYSGKDYDVTFVINRTPFRRFHQAINLFRRVGHEILFPDTNSDSKLKSPKYILRGKNPFKNLLLNERQQMAVRCIMEARSRPAPYVIFGPPGTGKTITLVEAIIQVFLTRMDSRLLVCAPSNSAVDLVCERLHSSGIFKTTDMIRLNAFHRSQNDIPEVVNTYCNSNISLDVMCHYRIVLATCMTSGLLYNLGIKPGHFTHVFIDEAGQATEPEALIPICLAAAQGIEDFQIVLAGDPKQLGPVLRSPLASQCGLEKSYIERICQNVHYRRSESKPWNYDPCRLTKLVDNYRSHPALISLSSVLFYDSELVPRAASDLALSLCDWEHLPNKEFPILFHGIRGEDLQEEDSPSWFNPEEVFQIVKYLQSLYGIGLTPDDIGIVTPYRKQVEKIELLLKSVETVAPKVGSVEEFQGQERLAILVSTVRSSDDWRNFDKMHNLGFLSNPKRFNVALTRAQALLVIVGNPFVLAKDFYWRSLIRFCLFHGVYVGCDLEELSEMLQEPEDDHLSDDNEI